MATKVFKVFTITIFALCVLAIGALAIFPAPWDANKSAVEPQPRVVIPRTTDFHIAHIDQTADFWPDQENLTSWVPLADGYVVVSAISGFFAGGVSENQFVAYRSSHYAYGPIYLTFIDYDVITRTYRRLWTAATAATRPDTVHLSTMDLLGDRSLSVLLSGVNNLGEHTLTVFRLNPEQLNSGLVRPFQNTRRELFTRIAELRIDGNISVREVDRPLAYHMGRARGASFTIVGFGRDFESSNILDQIEVVYAFNPYRDVFERRSRTRIPGHQVEQRRVREILGNSRAFENFAAGLWFHVSPQGTLSNDKHIYFDPINREIIFYGEGNQQVFHWRNSTPTRYGLFISGQNNSVSSMRRSIDIELESLDSVRIRIIENVRLPIRVSSPWDGSYRKMPVPRNEPLRPVTARSAHIDAVFDSPLGRIHFFADGSYELISGGSEIHGHYAFFHIGDEEFLELRSTENRNGGARPLRETFLVEGENPITLYRVRLGSRGVERLNERPLTLTLSEG